MLLKIIRQKSFIYKIFLCVCFLIFMYLGTKVITSSRSNRGAVIEVPTIGEMNFHYKRTLWKTDNSTSVFPTIVDGKDINPQIVDYVKITGNTTKDVFVNLHSYNLNPNMQKCKTRITFLLIVIHSAANHFKERNRIRSTYGSVEVYRGRNITTVFMIGSVKDNILQNKINRKISKHGDIVQGNFIDDYKNLVKKHVMALHWYKHNCNAKYILKLDDDTFINPYRMVDYLIGAEPSGRGILCKIAERYAPVRDPKSKYHTPVTQYPFKILPNFCVGFAYLTTPEVWSVLYQASETTKVMDMDDVYVTGILAIKTKVKLFDFSDILLPCIHHSKFDLNELKRKPFVCYLYGETAFKHWNKVKNNQR